MRRRLTLLGLWLLLAPGWPAAAGIDRLQVERDHNRFRLHLQARLAVQLPAVWAVLTDFPGLHRLSPAILESRVLDGASAGFARVRTLSHVCVWIFCKDLEHVQRMYAPRTGQLLALSEPEASDFSAGQVRWLLSADGGGTQLEMWAEMVPSFWVPPVVGPYLVQQGLRGTVLETLDGLERQARLRSP